MGRPWGPVGTGARPISGFKRRLDRLVANLISETAYRQADTTVFPSRWISSLRVNCKGVSSECRVYFGKGKGGGAVAQRERGSANSRVGGRAGAYA